jgi:short-subunit dehydrogenase
MGGNMTTQAPQPAADQAAKSGPQPARTEAEFRHQFGPWGFVAGASTGTGLALANELAARGLNVVMLARKQDRLLQAASQVRERHGVEVRELVADLADPEIGTIVAGATDDLEIGLLIYNATVPLFGRFLDSSLDLHVQSVAVNCTTPVVLCHLFAPGMVARGRGGIGIVGSNAATQGSINFSTYSAGKAFEWILAESLWAELGDHGVDVCTVLSGPIGSPSYLEYQKSLDASLCNRPDSPDLLDRARARLMDPSQPAEVAVALLEGLGRGPVCYAHPLDEDVSRTCFTLPRAEAVALKRAYHETPRIDHAGLITGDGP